LFDITQLPLWAVLGTLLGVAAINYGLERSANIIFAKLQRPLDGLRLPLRKVLLIALNLALFPILGLRLGQLHHLGNLPAAAPWLISGIVLGIVVGALTYRMILTSDQGGAYAAMISRSPWPTLATVSILVGPAEDLFFLGILQYTLAVRCGWIAIPIYLVSFVAYHYLNVLSGAESNREFVGMLPIRLAIAVILSLSFYATGSLVYTYLIHNAFDTLNALAVLTAVRRRGRT